MQGLLICSLKSQHLDSCGRRLASHAAKTVRSRLASQPRHIECCHWAFVICQDWWQKSTQKIYTCGNYYLHALDSRTIVALPAQHCVVAGRPWIHLWTSSIHDVSFRYLLWLWIHTAGIVSLKFSSFFSLWYFLSGATHSARIMSRPHVDYCHTTTSHGCATCIILWYIHGYLPPPPPPRRWLRNGSASSTQTLRLGNGGEVMKD